MKKQLVFLSALAVVGAFPAWASARPHHPRHPVALGAVPPPLALRLQPVSFDQPEPRAVSDFEFTPGEIDRDRIPVSAADHFGRGGVASIGYEPGPSKSVLGAHELNAAFSSQSMAFGGMVGGGVSLHF